MGPDVLLVQRTILLALAVTCHRDDLSQVAPLCDSDFKKEGAFERFPREQAETGLHHPPVWSRQGQAFCRRQVPVQCSTEMRQSRHLGVLLSDPAEFKAIRKVVEGAVLVGFWRLSL